MFQFWSEAKLYKPRTQIFRNCNEEYLQQPPSSPLYWSTAANNLNGLFHKTQYTCMD